MNIQEILKCLPHRSPFLMVDKITQLIKGESVTALKLCSYNEPYFQGHFPDNPIMPGVLIVEAMAQASGILISQELKENQLCVLAAITDVKFKGIVKPGNTLELYCNKKFGKMGIWKFECSAFVNVVTIAEAKLTIASIIPE